LFLVLPLPNFCMVENRDRPVIFRFTVDTALAKTEVDLLSTSGQIWQVYIQVWNGNSFDNFDNILSSSTMRITMCM